MASFCRPGFTCLDIGANAGAITLAMTKAMHGDGHVVAFEPGPCSRRLLANLDINPSVKENVTAVKLGLGDMQGSLILA